MGSSPWSSLVTALPAALVLLTVAHQPHLPQELKWLGTSVVFALGDEVRERWRTSGFGGSGGQVEGVQSVSGSSNAPIEHTKHMSRERATSSHVKITSSRPKTLAVIDEHPDRRGPSSRGEDTTQAVGSGGSSVPADTVAETSAGDNGDSSPISPLGSNITAEVSKEGREEEMEPEGLEQFDVTTARRLVETMEKAAEVAASAAAAVESVLQDVSMHKMDCEAKSSALGEEIRASSARLQQVAAGVSKAVDALVEMRKVELEKFVGEMTEINHSQEISALAQHQQSLLGALTSLKKKQEESARDLEMLNSSYLSLEGNIQEQLKRMLASADEASANSYRLLSERFRELTEAKVAEIQQAYNSHRLDELAADRAIVDMIGQLKKKGVAVVDVSDVFPGHGFEAVRKELVVRIAKRVKAFFLPVFIVTQTQDEFSDWLYTRYHLVPSMRMIETIIDELSFVSDREAYAVVRVESVSTEVIIRRPEPPAELFSAEGGDQGDSAVLKEVEERQKMQVQSLTQGRVLPFVSQPSQESLVMARGPFFGAEVVKRFDGLTKAYLRTMVGGHLSRRAVLIVYMGDRKGEIARPTPGPQEVLWKLDMAEKLCTSFSAPTQEVAALWRHMEAEVPFYSIFFRVDPLVFDAIPVSVSFEPAKLPPLPPSPLFRGEFGVVQIQALRRGGRWLIPSSRAIHAAVSYVNRHSERGGVQALVYVLEEKITTFWRSKVVHDVEVTIRSADVPHLRLHLGVTHEDFSASRGKFSAEEPVVAVDGQGAVQQYLTQAVAKLILPAVGARASFRRLLFHVCLIGTTC